LEISSSTTALGGYLFQHFFSFILSHSQLPNLATLQYDHEYWRRRIPEAEKGLPLESRLHLIFSLTMYLSISVRQLIYWIFTTNIPSVSRRVSVFMGFNESESTPEAQFGPAMLFGLWRDRIRWPRAQRHLRTMTVPCAHELALQDSNRLINNPELRIKMKTLTIHNLRTLLHPQKLIQVFKDLAPFMWQILHTFSASPNNHRRRQAAEIAVLADDLGEDDPMPDVDSEDEEDWADDPNLESGEVDPNSVPSHWPQEYVGFARNPVFVSRFVVITLSCRLIQNL
jgi:hypothetical protein